MKIIKTSLKMKLRGRVHMKNIFSSQGFSIYTVFQLTRSINLKKRGCLFSGTYPMLLIFYVRTLYSSFSPPSPFVKSITWNMRLTNSWQKDIAQGMRQGLVWHLYDYLVQRSPSLCYFPSVFLQRLMVSDQIRWTLP